MLNKQTHRKANETLKLKLNKPREIFVFNPPISIEDSRTMGLTSLKIYNSFFHITEQNSKFGLYKFPNSKIGGVSYDKVRDEIEKDFKITYNTATDFQDDIIGPVIIEEYRAQVTKTMKNDE